MELKRKMLGKLMEWRRESKGSTAVLIAGARRVGKSYVAQKFAKIAYKSYIVIDFSNISKQVIEIFENDTSDLKMFFTKIAVFYGVKLYHRDTLFIFDEIQMYPKARQLIKHLVAEGSYDYLETGSLITLKQNVENIVLPSEEETMNMYPLDFEEFLWSLGDEVSGDYIRECYAQKKQLGAAIHRKLMYSFRQYMLVGGMPQSVVEYIKDFDFDQADRVKRRILTLYRNDITKFAKGYESKVRNVFDGIPEQLSKHEKKYVLASISKQARLREYEDAFIWLEEAMVTNTCFNSTDPSIGLKLNTDRLTMKCYMADTGLLFSLAFSDQENTENEVYKAILLDRLNLNEGMYAENVVAQVLKSNGHKLFFYSYRDKENGKDTMEIDFLIRKGKKICPVEVKSSNYLSAHSLNKFRNKYGNKLGDCYIVCTKDYNEKEGIVYIPFYMAMCL